MVVRIVLVVVVVLHSLPYLGARIPVAVAWMRVRVSDSAGRRGRGRGRCSRRRLILRRGHRILLVLLLLLMVLLLLLLLVLLLRLRLGPGRAGRRALLLAGRRLPPFALPVHRIHFRQRLEGIPPGPRGVGRVGGRVSGVRGGWAVAAVVPRRRASGWRPPHEHRLPGRLATVHFRLHVLYFRREHAVRGPSHRRASSGIARRACPTLEGVSAASSNDPDVGGVLLLLLLLLLLHGGRGGRGHGARRVGRAAHAARVSRLHVAVLGRLAQLLAVELLLRFAGQLVGLVRRQGHVDETVVRCARVVLGVVGAQGPVLEQVLRGCGQVSVTSRIQRDLIVIQENLFEALVLVEPGKEASTLGKNGRLLITSY